MDANLILQTFVNLGAVGIIAYFFVRNSNKLEQQRNSQFDKLINNILTNNNSLTTRLDKLVESISKNTLFNTQVLDDIVKQLSGIKQDYVSHTNQITECILDDRCISIENFKKQSINYIRFHFVDCLNHSFQTIDNNGFTSLKAINLLKDNLLRTIDEAKNGIIQDSGQLGFNGNFALFQIPFEAIIEEKKRLISDYILSLTLEDLKSDVNYKTLKASLRNIIVKAIEETIIAIKKT